MCVRSDRLVILISNARDVSSAAPCVPPSSRSCRPVSAVSALARRCHADRGSGGRRRPQRGRGGDLLPETAQSLRAVLRRITGDNRCHPVGQIFRRRRRLVDTRPITPKRAAAPQNQANLLVMGCRPCRCGSIGHEGLSAGSTEDRVIGGRWHASSRASSAPLERITPLEAGFLHVGSGSFCVISDVLPALPVYPTLQTYRCTALSVAMGRFCCESRR
jgi:hypothetical protein